MQDRAATPYVESHGHLPIPRPMVQMAWVLDSILNQVDPAVHPEIANLRHRLSSGTIADFSALNHHELSNLGALLAVTASQLAHQAEPGATPSYAAGLLETSDDGL